MRRCLIVFAKTLHFANVFLCFEKYVIITKIATTLKRIVVSF